MSETIARLKELDAIAAEKIMGWNCFHDLGERTTFKQISPDVHCIIYHGMTDSEPIQAVRVFDFVTNESRSWSPSRSIEDAFSLLPNVGGYWLTLYENRRDNGWRASFCGIGKPKPPIDAVASTPELAITKAVLLVMEAKHGT